MHHERDSDKYHAVRAMLNNLLKLTRRKELEPRTAGSALRPSRPPRRSSTTATAPGSISCATPATSRPRRPKTSPWSFTTGAATTSTFCCATSPRLFERGRRKRVKRPMPWPRLHQSQRQHPRAGQTLQAAIKRPQPPLPPSPLQVGRKVPADELGPAEVCGQHASFPQPGQHDRRPQGLHPQAAASSR